MKKLLVALLFGFTLAVSHGQSTDEKAINDPAELQAFVSAVKTADPAAKGPALEAFVRQYPHSVMLIAALDGAVGAYMQAGNIGKSQEMLGTLLAVDPSNTKALAIACYADSSSTEKGNAAALRAAAEHCGKGLAVLPGFAKPEYMSETDFKWLRDAMSVIFNGGLGFVALNRKQWAAARSFYLRALAVDPDDVANNYQISIASLSMKPIAPDGLWYAARAAVAALRQSSQEADRLMTYARSKYVNHHGSQEGWDQFVAAVAKQPVPPVPLGVTLVTTDPESGTVRFTGLSSTADFEVWRVIGHGATTAKTPDNSGGQQNPNNHEQRR